MMGANAEVKRYTPPLGSASESPKRKTWQIRHCNFVGQAHILMKDLSENGR